MSTLLESGPTSASPEPAPTRWRRDRWRRADPSVPVLGALLLLTAVIRLVNLTGNPQRLDDEGTYVAQAYAVTHYGELAHYTYWYDHPPLGWLQLALWSLFTGSGSASNAVAAGRGFMVVLAVITAALLWALARRLEMSRWAAAAAVGVFALSPLAVQLGRTVYLDNIATAWLLATFVLLCSPGRRLSAVFGAAASFGVAVLSKETMLLALPAVVWLAWTRSAPAIRRYAMAVLGTVFGLVLTVYVLTAAVRSELFPGAGHVSLLDGIRFQLWQRRSGGSVFDGAAANRGTLDGWITLDPVLLAVALPATIAALFVRRLRPIALGVAVFAAALLRQGYLPVPFVIAAIPLVALLTAGLVDGAVRYVRVGRTGLAGRPLAVPALVAAGLAVAVAIPLWTPTLRDLTTADADAPIRAAEAWIGRNVPHPDRIIVDDALWVDLIRQDRDRRDVVWFYKVDTDDEVRSWSPHGWRDYDWVVSTSSLRAGLPATGDLADAVAAGTPAAVFGTGHERVEVLRVDPTASGDTARTPTAGTGELLADLLADTAEPAALGILRSGRTDPRVLATLSVLSATEPVFVTGLPAVAGEDAAATPRRQLLFAAAGARSDRIAAFFRAQSGPYAVDSVQRSPEGLLVRFPLRSAAGVLPGSVPAGPGPQARVRVADLRPGVGREQVDLVTLAGRAVGSLPSTSYGAVTGYHSVAPGSYLVTSRDPTNPGAPPILRQAVDVAPGGSYTLGLFTGPAGGDAVVSQLVPDNPPDPPRGVGLVQLLEGARDAGAVSLALDTPSPASGPDDPIILADGVGYGLVTGYAEVPAGLATAVVRSGGQERGDTLWVPSGGAMMLILLDSRTGPYVQPVPLGVGQVVPLEASTLTAHPPAAATAEAAPAESATTGAGDSVTWVLSVLAGGLALGAVGALAADRARRRGPGR